MNRTRKPLVLHRQSVRILAAPHLGRAIGGIALPGDPGNASGDMTGARTGAVTCSDTFNPSLNVCTKASCNGCGVLQ